MANTFKFGNGNWAVKDGSALAYNDENNNFKPLPFDFTRASSATTLNRQGLIETVGSGKPRIDFTDNTDGHLLLEPSRTNLVQRSEEFDNAYWTKNGSSVTSGFISPDGTDNAFKLTKTSSGNSIVRLVSGLTNVNYTFSIYIKKVNVSGNVSIILPNGGSTQVTISNEWERYDFTSLPSGGTGAFVGVILSTIGDEVLIYGAQLEQGSYATSYIPTEGSSETRVVDDIALTFPDVDSFNSSSGFSVVAKFDIGSAGTGTSAPFLFFNDDTSSTYMGFGSNATNLRCRLNLSGTSYLNTQSNAPRTQRNSLFISCDSSGWSQGANGSTNHTGTNNASVFDRLANISFITTEVYGIIKISELLVFNTRLTNTELQNLTS